MSPFKDRVIDIDATVYSRLTKAGAILVAKLSTGALAVTAQWFGGLTRNPWNTEQDAAGSSAGPGRGDRRRTRRLLDRDRHRRVDHRAGHPKRHQRPAADIRAREPLRRHDAGVDAGHDRTDVPLGRRLRPRVRRDRRTRRQGQHRPRRAVQLGRLSRRHEAARGLPAAARRRAIARSQTRRNNEEALRVIRSLGVTVVPFDLPEVPIEAIDFIRYAETAAAFDDVTRSGVLTQVEQGPEKSRRPDEIRSGLFHPGRRVHPGQPPPHASHGAGRRSAGRSRPLHRQPTGVDESDRSSGDQPAERILQGSPTALHLTGKLFGEQEILLLAHAFQARTDYHQKHPDAFR